MNRARKVVFLCCVFAALASSLQALAGEKKPAAWKFGYFANTNCFSFGYFANDNEHFSSGLLTALQQKLNGELQRLPTASQALTQSQRDKLKTMLQSDRNGIYRRFLAIQTECAALNLRQSLDMELVKRCRKEQGLLNEALENPLLTPTSLLGKTFLNMLDSSQQESLKVESLTELKQFLEEEAEVERDTVSRVIAEMVATAEDPLQYNCWLRPNLDALLNLDAAANCLTAEQLKHISSRTIQLNEVQKKRHVQILAFTLGLESEVPRHKGKSF